ncbi:MAG: FhaA domain-containing protein [Actinomycetota bacterium]
MPILRDFERRLGNLVEGFFASTFRSGLQPVELAKRLLREMDDGKTVGVHEVWAPNHFVFSLSPEDAERFEQAEQALISELKEVVREAAAERGWGLVGPPEVEFQVDRNLSRGRFSCEASLVEGEPEAPQPSTRGDEGPGAAEASLTVLDDGHPGKRYRLGRASVTIGRLPECDIVVSDPGASRQHAQIRFDGERFVLNDLGSTNGTLVNDETADERALEDGDRITIGSTVLEFRAG